MRAVHRLSALVLTILVVGASSIATGQSRDAAPPPNVIVILMDDMGYGDIGVFGSKANQTPQIDRLASQGVKATNFYAQPVCTASRASLLTGSYPVRVGMGGALMPGSPTGLSLTEATLPRVLKQRGYATALFGKWHLGDRPAFMPPRQGFDDRIRPAVLERHVASQHRWRTVQFPRTATARRRQPREERHRR